VREYARYVGLNAEDMVNRYNYAASQDDRIEKPPQIEKYPQTPVRDITPKAKPKRGIPSSFARVDRNAIVLVIIAFALVAVAWWAVKHKLIERELGIEPSTVPVAASKPVVLPPVTATVPPPPVDDSKLRLEIEAIDDAWVAVDADGQSVLNAELPRGERKNFEANDKFRFRTGNAAGITLRLNGIELPPLGAEGKVKTLVFDREALQNLRSTQ
jgi:hypothetical protein